MAVRPDSLCGGLACGRQNDCGSPPDTGVVIRSRKRLWRHQGELQCPATSVSVDSGNASPCSYCGQVDKCGLVQSRLAESAEPQSPMKAKLRDASRVGSGDSAAAAVNGDGAALALMGDSCDSAASVPSSNDFDSPRGAASGTRRFTLQSVPETESLDCPTSLPLSGTRRKMTRHGSLMLDGDGGGRSQRNVAFSRFSGADISLNNLRHSLREKSTGLLRRGLGSRRTRNRLVQKAGQANITLANVPKQGRKYFSDIFTTIIDTKWRYCLAMFAMLYALSWLFFALIFYIISVIHGDYLAENKAITPEKFTPCVANTQTDVPFVSILMFSVESQSTIGYGFRVRDCPLAGIVFAKLARPKKRADTIVFSKNAVVCMRDGRLCFLFRVGDMRKTQLAEAHVRLQMIKKLMTSEGEMLPFHQFDMDVGYSEGLDRVFVMWPITICHVIDEDSPLYDMCRADLQSERFEVIAILEGVVETTGSTTQARTSYVPQEVLWGHRFQKLVTYQRDNGEYRIDFGLFHSTYPVQCTDLSARQLDEARESGIDPTTLCMSTAGGDWLQPMDAMVVQRNYLSMPAGGASALEKPDKRPPIPNFADGAAGLCLPPRDRMLSSIPELLPNSNNGTNNSGDNKQSNPSNGNERPHLTPPCIVIEPCGDDSNTAADQNSSAARRRRMIHGGGTIADCAPGEPPPVQKMSADNRKESRRYLKDHDIM